MRATGIVRRVDDLGRIVIPKEIRMDLSIQDGTPLEILTDGKSIVLTKHRPACACCGRTEVPMMRTGELRVCKFCYSRFHAEEAESDD